MAYAMTKQGSMDNVITYEFICDTLTDMNAIENTYRTLGSVAIVLSGESEGLEVYIAGSNRQWNSLGAMGGESSGAAAGLVIHICSQNEYNANTLLPTVQTPDETTLYLVPASAESGNLYDEYIYVNEAWETFGSANINLSNYIQKTDIATQSTAGLVKVLDNGNVTFNENNQLVLTLAGTAVVKTGQSDHPISVTHQHEAAFYGLAKAAGQDMKNSGNAVGTYTTEAKAAIKSMIGVNVDDVQVDGTSIVSNGVANIPLATSQDTGLIKLGTGFWFNSTYNRVDVILAEPAQIKAGTHSSASIPIALQHQAVFYGLAKAAGDATQAASENAVGTYTDGAKAAIQAMLGIGNASAEAFGLVKVVSSNGIYIDGSNNALSINAASSQEIKAGLATKKALVPVRQHESVFYGLAKAAGDSTQESSENAVGTYTAGAKTAIQTMLSVPSNVDGVFTHSLTIGTRKVNTNTGPYSLTVGYDLVATGYYSVAFGQSNQSVGNWSVSEGYSCWAEGQCSHVEGEYTWATGLLSHAEGYDTLALGLCEHVSGQRNVYEADEWEANTTYAVGDLVLDPDYILKKCITANSDATFDSEKWEATTRYLWVVGNGTERDEQNDNRSNAASLDMSGNLYLNGYAYVGCNPDGTNGTRLIHDVQIKDASLVTNGVAKIPVAGLGVFGVTAIDSGGGLETSGAGALRITGASSADIKAGTEAKKPVTPIRQHEAVFYGLAKVAGDSTQASSANTVGTYTANAKVAIRSMLGIDASGTLIETVSGTTPAITGVPNTTYQCGEVSTMSITPPANGTVSVIFTSGSTATTLTVPNTVKFPAWFDATSLDTDTIYEIMITNGVYGSVMTWATT